MTGSPQNIFHIEVLADPVGTIPAILNLRMCPIVDPYSGVTERTNTVAVWLWTTIVCYPPADIIWGGGFLSELGVCSILPEELPYEFAAVQQQQLSAFTYPTPCSARASPPCGHPPIWHSVCHSLVLIVS